MRLRRSRPCGGSSTSLPAAVLVAHNARFDIGFLDREVELVEGRRLAAPVIDTVGLARRLLAGRVARASLGSLAHFFGTSVRPSHRALPDAEATAEILLRLIGLAQERGARTVADLGQLAAPRARRVYDKRALAFGAPSSPGVYLFVGKGEQILYVGARGTCASACAPISAASGSAPQSRRPWRPSSGSSGACSVPSSSRRSRSSA